VIAYLIAVRIVGYLVAKRYGKPASVDQAGGDA